MDKEVEDLFDKLSEYDAGDWTVTTLFCNSDLLTGEDLYTIGIRDKQTNEFKLMGNEFNHQSVQEVAEAITQLLSLSSGENATLHFTPEWCMTYFRGDCCDFCGK